MSLKVRTHVLSLIAVLFAIVFMASGAQSHEFKAGSIVIEHPWAAETPPRASTGAVYMLLRNSGESDDVLASGSTPIAESVELHRSEMTDGIMRMEQLEEGLSLSAQGSAAFEPGGYHVMLIGLKQPLKVGDRFPLTLVFEKAGEVTVDIEVEKRGAQRMQHGGGHGMTPEGGHGMQHGGMKR